MYTKSLKYTLIYQDYINTTIFRGQDKQAFDLCPP